jgi:hypothetical protein
MTIVSLWKVSANSTATIRSRLQLIHGIKYTVITWEISTMINMYMYIRTDTGTCMYAVHPLRFTLVSFPGSF